MNQTTVAQKRESLVERAQSFLREEKKISPRHGKNGTHNIRKNCYLPASSACLSDKRRCDMRSHQTWPVKVSLNLVELPNRPDGFVPELIFTRICIFFGKISVWSGHSGKIGWKKLEWVRWRFQRDPGTERLARMAIF